MNRQFPLPKHHLLALAGYTIITVLITFPLVLNFSTHVLGWAKLDSYEYLWKLWWVPHALFEQNVSPWLVPHIYYPYGYPLVYGEVTPLHSFLLMPVTMIFGEIITYNLITVLSTIVTGWSLYSLTRQWILRLSTTVDTRLLFFAAFYAGAAFTFSPYRVLKLTGHLNLFDTQWLVLALFFWDRWLVSHRVRDAALTALNFALAALSSWYYALLLLTLLPVYTLAYGKLLTHLNSRKAWLGLLFAAGIVFVLCVPFLLPYLEVEGIGSAPLGDAAFWSASPTDYILPNPYHPIWGGFFRQLAWPFPTPILTEFAIPVGLITLLFALLAWRQVKGRSWRALKWLIFAAFVLSLGPFLHISRLSLDIPMPALLLRELPVFGNIRTWIRFATMVFLGVSILAGTGVYLGLASVERKSFRYAGALAVIGAMLFGSWSGSLGLSPVEPRPVDDWLAQEPDDSPIMEYPLSVALSGPSLFYTRYHGKPITYAYGTFLEYFYREHHAALLTFPEDAALDQLEEWGVRYILITVPSVHGERNFTMAQVTAQPRLHHIITLADVAVYALQREIASEP